MAYINATKLWSTCRGTSCISSCYIGKKSNYIPGKESLLPTVTFMKGKD